MDTSVKLSNEARKKLCWWTTNIMSSLKHTHILIQTLIFALIQVHHDGVSQKRKIHQQVNFYHVFPHFSFLGKVIEKMHRDKMKVILVVTKWPTQHWYPGLLRKVTRKMTIIPSAKILLQRQWLATSTRKPTVPGVTVNINFLKK